MNDTLSKTLGQAELGRPVSHNSLHLFPLVGGPTFAEEGVTLLDEGLEGGTLRVEELGESGSVPELRVVNGGSRPVLILEGDELIGAKQNRVVNSSVLVAANSELVLPVSCVERGRWSRRASAFAAGDSSPHVALRRLKSRAVHDSLRRGRGHKSDQSAVWEEVDRVAYLHGAASLTHALQDTRASLAGRLADYTALADQLPQRTRGVVVALGGRPALVEVLAGPRSFAKVSKKLLAGYVLEALEHDGESAAPHPSAATRFVGSVAVACREEHPAVGDGVDVRLGAEGLSGYALISGERVMHAVAFADSSAG